MIGVGQGSSNEERALSWLSYLSVVINGLPRWNAADLLLLLLN